MRLDESADPASMDVDAARRRLSSAVSEYVLVRACAMSEWNRVCVWMVLLSLLSSSSLSLSPIRWPLG